MQTFDKLKDMEKRVDELEKELHWALVYEIESVSNLDRITTLANYIKPLFWAAMRVCF